MARPRKHNPEKEAEIAKQVETLSGYHCSWTEIAAVTGENVDYLKKCYSLFYNKGREKGKTKLRHLMWESAKKGNVAMQIWLSKNLLGYTDKVEQVTENNAPQRLIIEMEPKKTK